MKHRARVLCENGAGRPGLPVPNCTYGLCGRKATPEEEEDDDGDDDDDDDDDDEACGRAL